MNLYNAKNIWIATVLFFLILLPFQPCIHGMVNDESINRIEIQDQYADGYMLIVPEYHKKSFIIDKDGREVKCWESDYLQALGAHLLDNKRLVRSCSKAPNPIFPFGGYTGRVEMFDWNGSIIWEFEYSNNEYCLHHDIEPLPNGNILLIAWEKKNSYEAINAGRNPDYIPANRICLDYIIEVEPTGSESGIIVWEWHMWDHLIQDFDVTKQNYGNIKNHPELIDMNYIYYADIAHINSIDYHPEFDQILLSVRNYNELWVIDHSTSIQEAAAHSGGRYGKGGDLLYRWGNPHAYKHGDADDQQLFWQHDARWIEPGCPGEGNILVFNNGINRPLKEYSTVEEIHPPINESGFYYREDNKAFAPETQTWVYNADDSTDFFSNRLSGAQRLPNGNTIICNGYQGYFFEVTQQNDLIWSYQNTMSYSFAKPLFDCFSVQWYPNDFPGIGSLEYLDPEKPSRPVGNKILKTGSLYQFTTRTTDPNGDDVLYFFDWGDGKDSGWLGSFSSGSRIEAAHYYQDSGFYQIRVKAKDVHGFESDWSDPLIVAIPKYKSFNTIFYDIFNRFFDPINLYFSLV